tara:strand:- start:587 stop:913 length:327 start_codon:yes stop_codon:yes gene_type:complete
MEENDAEKARLKAIRERLESHIMSTFQGKEMWYQEKRLQYKGTPDITTDAWGVTVHFECKRARPVHLSGRWDFIIAYADYIAAAYAGWSLSFECPHPEWEEEHDEDEK